MANSIQIDDGKIITFDTPAFIDVHDHPLFDAHQNQDALP